MYNGIGLKTTRGTGTSGHVQRNVAAIRNQRRRTSTETRRSTHETLRQLLKRNKSGSAAILAHESQRKVEVAVAELEEDLHERGYDQETIDKMKQRLRDDLENRGEQEQHTASRRDLEDKDIGKRAVNNLQSHKVTEIQQHRNERLKEAFGIAPEYEDDWFIKSNEKNGKEQASNDVADSDKVNEATRNETDEERLDEIEDGPISPESLPSLPPSIRDGDNFSSPSHSAVNSPRPSASNFPDNTETIDQNSREYPRIKALNKVPESEKASGHRDHGKDRYNDKAEPATSTRHRRKEDTTPKDSFNNENYSPGGKRYVESPGPRYKERSPRPEFERKRTPPREGRGHARERSVYKRGEKYKTREDDRQRSLSPPRYDSSDFEARHSRRDSRYNRGRYMSDSSRSPSPAYHRSRRRRDYSSESDDSSPSRSRRHRYKRTSHRNRGRSSRTPPRRRYDSSTDSRSPSPRYSRDQDRSDAQSRGRNLPVSRNRRRPRYSSRELSRYSSESDDQYQSANRKRSLSSYSSSASPRRGRERIRKRFRDHEREDSRERDYMSSDRRRRRRRRSPISNA